MGKSQEIMSTFLLVFQICLGFWQFVKFTPVGGLVQGGFKWLLSLLPFGLSSDYVLLQRFPGGLLKQVGCLVPVKDLGSHDELAALIIDPLSGESTEIIDLSYLGKDFRLERMSRDKLFINGQMAYYITESIWQNLLVMIEVQRFYDGRYVYLKGYKEFWELVVTGGVMEFSEVLDCIILENFTIMQADTETFLPVNLSLSEEKVLKLLNLVGLFLQTKKVFWLIPTLLSLASAILEFITILRVWLYSNINRVFCSSMHTVCDKLSYSMRRQVYSLGKWIENFKPCNDLQLSTVRGDICAPMAGGAKADNENATAVPWLNVEEGETKVTFPCDPIDISCAYAESSNICCVAVTYLEDVAFTNMDCKNREEFMKLCTFVDCVARNRSGSLKSYDGKKKVTVRGWKESVRHYVKNGYPPIYELRFENVIVTGI